MDAPAGSKYIKDEKLKCSRCGRKVEIRTTPDGAREARCALCGFCLFIFQGGKQRGW